MNDLLAGRLENLDVKKMIGYRNLFRLRVGRIRILFRIIEDKGEIVDLDFRGGVY